MESWDYSWDSWCHLHQLCHGPGSLHIFYCVLLTPLASMVQDGSHIIFTEDILNNSIAFSVSVHVFIHSFICPLHKYLVGFWGPGRKGSSDMLHWVQHLLFPRDLSLPCLVINWLVSHCTPLTSSPCSLGLALAPQSQVLFSLNPLAQQDQSQNSALEEKYE